MKCEKKFEPMFCAICYMLLSAPVLFAMENISPVELKSPEEMPIPDVEKLVIIKFTSYSGIIRITLYAFDFISYCSILLSDRF